MKTLLAVLGFALLFSSQAIAQSNEHAHHAAVNERGDKVMGFSHEKTAHHFRLKADGGLIEVEIKDKADAASREQIQSHLKHIAHKFAEGDFNAPMLIHDKVPPGVPVMKESKSAIKYQFEQTELGGRVRITTKDKKALTAVHEFLRFQISDHKTGDSTEVEKLSQIRELASPAGAGSGQPNLTVSRDGKIFLSWIERLGEGKFSLRFATKEGDGWSAPRVIAEGSNWFVNWADFPSMIVLPDGTLAAHWLVKSGPGTFDYDVTISRSFDSGKSWGKPFVAHRDGVKTEHGFVSLFAAKDGQLAAVWLDGREMTSGGPDGKKDDHGHGHGNMTLRYVKIKRDGTLTDEARLDAKVCECCQTSAAMTADGPVVVYRDRSDAEIRDISVVRLKAGKWTEPRPVHDDNWKLNGCPVNGPSVAAAGNKVAVAWFTAAADKPQVSLAFSSNSGESFDKPIRIDDGNPVGRVETLMLADGSALVCWLEKATGSGSVRVRRIHPDGKMDESIAVAPNGTARSNGFPQMVATGKTLVFAWTSSRVMTATMPLP